MAASLVQSKAAAQNTGDATVDATWDTPATAGNLLLIIVGADDYAASPPTDFTQSTGCGQETFLGHYVWWKVAAGGETSATYTIGSAAPSCWITAEYSGLTASPYDTSDGTFIQSSSTTMTTPTITPTTGDRLLIASIGGSLSNTMNGMGTWLNSFTERQDIWTTLGSGTRDNVGMADRSVTGDGSTGFSSGATYAQACQSRTGIIIAFKVAAGGTDATATPAVIATTATVPRPGVNVSAAPSVVAAVAALPRPAVNVQASPAVVATTVTLPTPTPETAGNVTVQPAAVATVATVPRPGVNIAAGPAVVPVTVTLPQPGVNVAAGPAVIPCTVALATATPAGGTTVTPNAITTTITVPATAVSVSAGPATIAVTVTIPLPGTGGAPVKALSDPEVVHAVASVAAVSALRTSSPTVTGGTSTPTVG